MDIATYLQSFESRFSSYTGDDPLDPWDKFVEYLEQRLPADGGAGMSVVFDALVQRFLNVERYADDIRYVNYCIKCASYYSDPIALYSHIFSRGVGTRTAALYVAWAQQFEQRGMNEQADAVYQKASENQAEPADTVLHEYRQFQARARSQAPGSAGGRTPLQNSHLTNQMASSREAAAQSKASVEPLSKAAAVKTTIIVSRSETSGMIPSGHSSGVQTVAEYMKDELVCEGSELSFEEVRAAKYFSQRRERREKEQRETMERRLREHEEGIRSMESILEKLDHSLKACGGLSGQRPPVVEAAAPPKPNPTQQALGRPRPSVHLSSRRSLGLRLHTEPAFIHEAVSVPNPPHQQTHMGPVDSSVRSSGSSRRSSVLTDRSVHLPPASAEPAPGVQTSTVQPLGQMDLSLHRAPGVSAVGRHAAAQPGGWDASQPQERNATHPDVSHSEPEDRLNASQGATGNLSLLTPNNSLGYVQATPSRVLPSPTVNTREALDVIMDMFQAPTLLEDPFSGASGLHAAEREGGSPGYGGAAAALTHPPSATPFTIFQDDNDKENGSAAGLAAGEKLKPIRALAEIPASKPDKPNDTPPELMQDESTMWGARYNALYSLAACPNSTTDFAMLAQCVSTPATHKTPFFFLDQENTCDGDAFIRRQTKKLSPIMELSPPDENSSEAGISQLVPSSARQGTIMGEVLTTSSVTMVQPPPPALLSFKDQTLSAADSSDLRTTGPGWEVYASPEQPSRRASPVSQKPQSPARKGEPFKILEDDLDKPSSPGQKPDSDVPMSPVCALQPDRMTTRSPEAAADPDLDSFPSPHPHNTTVPMSPEPPRSPGADVPMSPVQLPQLSATDEPMLSPDRGTTSRGTRLVPDPWDNELIQDLLSTLRPPLAAHPDCITWQCHVPNITPKMTISMGKASLQVDCVLGQGAFATVFQATDPMTSERMVLKVQKPANPWEFYIDTQLDARLQPAVRHLYSAIRSAHLFRDGSVLLGELHNYGTLLNVVNMYKAASDKVMPQPLVMYFTMCILHMVEQLHRVHIVHADIKPDNFLLGERFLDNKCFDEDNLDHGLVLVDLGQSIDMDFFPEGTAFTAKCLTSGFQCTEMLSGKPWSYQTDYFGIAGTVHCLLFGTYMEVVNQDGVWKTNSAFRRNPHSDLWLDLFHTLLNVPDGGALPSLTSLTSLRRKLASVLQENYSRKLSTLKSRLVVLLLENRKAARR